MTKVTERQKEVLQAIVNFTKEHKYPPTVRELCKEVNLSSSSTVHGMLQRLKIHGLVTWEPDLPRTLTVVSEVEKHEKVTS